MGIADTVKKNIARFGESITWRAVTRTQDGRGGATESFVNTSTTAIINEINQYEAKHFEEGIVEEGDLVAVMENNADLQDIIQYDSKDHAIIGKNTLKELGVAYAYKYLVRKTR